MSKYEFKTYQEEFLEAQERVGNEVTKGWLSYNQSPAARLKEVYSQPDFDPETKHYAFLNDELVGFLTSRILPESEDGVKRARMQFPLVLPGHEECAEILFEKAVSTLKNKGVKVIRTRAGEIWGNTLELAEKWGFKFSSDLLILKEMDLRSAEFEESDEFEISDYDHSRDFEQMVQIFIEKFEYSEERAKANFEEIASDKEQYPIHLVLREEGQIVARGLVLRTDDPKVANMGTFFVQETKYLKPLFSKIANMLKAGGVEKVTLPLFRVNLLLRDQYASLGFSEVGKIAFYEKEI